MIEINFPELPMGLKCKIEGIGRNSTCFCQFVQSRIGLTAFYEIEILLKSQRTTIYVQNINDTCSYKMDFRILFLISDLLISGLLVIPSQELSLLIDQ